MHKKGKKKNPIDKAQVGSKRRKKKTENSVEDAKEVDEVREDDEMRDGQVRDDQVRDDQVRDDQVRDDQMRDDQMRDDQTSETRGRETVEAKGRSRVCPYLRTINRNLLDFDFEKLCSISLSNLHVYACLVCGVYFQGIGKGTYAYTHALEKNHYVFINLETCKTCCVPENYEIEDASLNDIKYFLKPVYSREQVEYICQNSILGKSLDGADFFPGFVGLNNLKNTDYCNVIIQLVCNIIPLRNFFLLFDSRKYMAKNIISSLSELIKKIYNPRNFKGVVSPHEFLQTVGIESKKKFKIGSKNDPLDFFLWLLCKIHRYEERVLRRQKTINVGKREKTGENRESEKIEKRMEEEEDDRPDGQNKGQKQRKRNEQGEKDKKKIQPSYEHSQFNVILSSSNETDMSEDGDTDMQLRTTRKKENKKNKKMKKKKKKGKKKRWMYDEVNIIDYCFDGELIIKTKKKKKKNTEEDENMNMTNVHNTKKSDGNEMYDEPNAHEEDNFSHKLDNEKEEGRGDEDEEADNVSDEDNEDDVDIANGGKLRETKNYIIEKIPFRTLSLKLPNPPIFKSTTESNIIPQVSIFELLTKFNGETESFLNEKSEPSTLIISKLPKYLIFTIKRFSKNNFFVEKNGTIVNFVIKNLDMKDYIHENYLEQNPVTKYNLIANIFHNGSVNTGTYKIHVLNQASNEWYEIEDLHVITVLPQLVLLPESCVQLYQRQDVQLNGEII
ncbi:U4/U6.U5 tri-snRNP-associated protein 2 [Plasmodium gonderi]|uniref:U4/U6.U5 tri-snRNP-associated protein 2 n=1 Tax=Plasmodium gonderi TaxID=77519 RepID=A0A1Y1JQ71_PLAGO|nr:U4/U6.U5 tri-snRNP-associated protein 2 [Plasmodium gonderi]GAW83377.1 U4/U6.U5 tri-snRNP-associated protein 2 [Plasmodium gonderi]